MNKINYVAFTGKLPRDPKTFTSTSGTSNTSFSLRVETPRKKQDGTTYNETCFLDCKAWGNISDQCQGLMAGSEIEVEGRMKWEKAGTCCIKPDKGHVVCKAYTSRMMHYTAWNPRVDKDWPAPISTHSAPKGDKAAEDEARKAAMRDCEVA